MNENENKLELLIDNNLYTYNVKMKRGFNELLEEIKLKYGQVETHKYWKGYFNPQNMKFEITDYYLKNEFDELNPKKCIIYVNHYISDYQAFAGEAIAIKYPNIYRILTKNFNVETIIELSDWYINENSITELEKENIISEILEYLQFELTSIEDFRIDTQVNNDLKEKVKKLENVKQLFNNVDIRIKELLFSKINSDMEKHYKKKITDRQYTKKIFFNK